MNCSNCGHDNSESSKFCAQCGSHLVAASAGAERRRLTVMFVDLVGSTNLSEKLDPEDLAELIDAYQKTCRRQLTSWDGFIARPLGDGLMVYFGYPQAHENAAVHALHAGLDILAEMPRLNEEFRERFPVLVDQPLAVRIGVHTGLVVIGEVGAAGTPEQIALGDTPNIAARIQGQAGPNELWIGRATHGLTGERFEYEQCGSFDLKGISEPVQLFRVKREGNARSRFEAAVSRGLSPLIGRENEWRRLVDSWGDALSGPSPAILLRGDPGIGKSRLARELGEYVQSGGGRQIEFHCFEHRRNSALFPVIDHLERLLKFETTDSPETKLDKLEYRLASYTFLEPDTLQLLCALLSLPDPPGLAPLKDSASRKRVRTREALVNWLLEETGRAPVICIWEDLHWSDPSSLDLLELLISRMQDSRMQLVLTARPEFDPNRLDALEPIDLGPLAEEESAALAASLSGWLPEAGSEVPGWVTRCDGVPLFIEETARMLRDQRSDPMEDAVPGSVTDLLAARIDRLGPAKAIAQLAATIGRRFPFRLLAAVCDLPDSALRERLDEVLAGGFIRPEGRDPEGTYLFKHALIRDVAYQSLLRRERREHHRRIAHTLEDGLDTAAEPEVVAHHFTEAEEIAAAIPHWLAAGQRANRRSAHVEALAQLDRALELIPRQAESEERDRMELDIHLARGIAALASKGLAAEEAGDAGYRAYTLCKKLGEPPETLAALAGLRIYYTVRGDMRRAVDTAQEMLRIADASEDADLQVQAHYGLGVCRNLQGRFRESLTHYERALELNQSDADGAKAQRFAVDPEAAVRGLMSLPLVALGYPDLALTRARQSLERARAISHPHSIALALQFLGLVYMTRGDLGQHREISEENVIFCKEQELPFWGAEGVLGSGRSLIARGEVEEGLALFREGLQGWADTGARGYGTNMLLGLAKSCTDADLLDEALTHLDHAEELGIELDEHWVESELKNQRGHILLLKGQRDQGERALREALELARRQEALGRELTPVVSLARLWLARGEPSRAEQLLTETYNRFTEGFSTQALSEARALIEEIQGSTRPH